MGRSRYHFIHPDQPHFMTLTVQGWLPVFTRPESVQILLDAFGFLMSESLQIHAWVVLENHLHLIAQSPQLDKDISRFKSFTARKLIQYLQKQKATTLLNQFQQLKLAHKTDRQWQLWQEGVHPEWIGSIEMMQQKIEYIHQNPVKRGYVDLAEHWRYSSARDYAGGAGLLPVDKSWWTA
jgi:putative transposase